MAGAETHAEDAARVLFPFDSLSVPAETELDETEPDERGEDQPQTPASRPATQPAPPDVAENRLPEPTTAPASEPDELQPDDNEQPTHRQYVVQSGDTLWHIAERLLGDASRWHEILEINRDRLASPHELRVGLELRIPPETEEPTSKSPKQH